MVSYKQNRDFGQNNAKIPVFIFGLYLSLPAQYQDTGERVGQDQE